MFWALNCNLVHHSASRDFHLFSYIYPSLTSSLPMRISPSFLTWNLTVLKISDWRSLTILQKAHYILYALILSNPLYNSPQGIFLCYVFSFQLNSQPVMSSTLLFIGYKPDFSSLCLFNIFIIFCKKHLWLKKMSTKFPFISNCCEKYWIIAQKKIFSYPPKIRPHLTNVKS